MSGDVAVPAPPPEGSRSPVPLVGPIGDLDAAYRYACALAQADILPQDLRGKPSNVLLVILYGQYLGIPPVIATQVIYVVKGRPFIAGKMLLSKVREAGHKPRVVHGDGECTVTITRGDDGEVFEEAFSLEDAVTAKLCTIKDGRTYARSKQGEPLPWENHPKRMLMWRAVGACVDVACPEIKMGFGVQGEEEAESDRPALAQVAAERTDRATAPGPTPEEQAAADAAVLAEVADIEAQHTAGQPDSAPPPPDPADAASHKPNQSQMRRLFALLGEHGIKSKDVRLRFAAHALERDDLTSFDQLGANDVSRLINQLEQLDRQPPPDESEGHHDG